MLQKVSDHVANCLAQAAEAERRAAAASDEVTRIGNERMAKSWRHLASSYQFAVVVEADKRKGERSSDNLALAPLEPDTPAMRDLRRVVDTIGTRNNLLRALAAVCHDKAMEVGICQPLFGLEWLLLASDLEAIARARSGLR